jgi:hypothetical protein
MFFILPERPDSWKYLERFFLNTHVVTIAVANTAVTICSDAHAVFKKITLELKKA